ncbi:MAG: hypothetical protein WKF58_19565 [Ilumatobacteraceae bacterium]
MAIAALECSAMRLLHRRRARDLVEASRARVDEGLKSHVELQRRSDGDVRADGPGLHTQPITWHRCWRRLPEGFAIQDVGGEHQHLDRPGLGQGVGSDWTLFGTATQAVIEHFTEPT